MTNFFFYMCIGLFLLVCAMLILIVLIQKGRGGGLASAFGGAGGNTAFGSKTGDVLTWATSIIFGVFMVLAIALNLMANSREKARYAPVQGVQQNQPQQSQPGQPGSTPAAPAVPAGIPAPAPAGK